MCLPMSVELTDLAINSYVEDLEGRLERMEKLMNKVSRTTRPNPRSLESTPF